MGIDTRVRVPRNLDGVRAQVERFALAPTFPTGQAKQLEQAGWLAFVASVDHLQDLDYEDLEACRQASNVLTWLRQVTAVDGLDAEPLQCDPTEIDRCRYQALADGWRRLAEQFARTDADFRKLLAAQGKVGGER